MCLRVEVSAEVVTIKRTFKWANPLLCNPTPATHPPTIIPARMTYVMSRAETITSELWGSKRSIYGTCLALASALSARLRKHLIRQDVGRYSGFLQLITAPKISETLCNVHTRAISSLSIAKYRQNQTGSNNFP